MQLEDSDIRFSELITQCRMYLADDNFDQIFELLAQYEIPRQGNVVLAKALWLRLKIDKMQGVILLDDVDRKLHQIRKSLEMAFASLQDTYVDASNGYIETPSGFEVLPKERIGVQELVIKRKRSLLSFAKQKVISLDEFIGFIEEVGISRLESSGELQTLNGLILTWEGKAGSVVQLNPHNPNSDFYLIFWPVNDKMFQLDPLVAFFDHGNKKALEKIGRGDRVVIRGRLEISSNSPKLALRKATLLKHTSKSYGFR